MATYSSRRRMNPLTTLVVVAAIPLAVYFLGNTRTQEQEDSLYSWALERADKEGNNSGYTSEQEMADFCGRLGLPYYNPDRPSKANGKDGFIDAVESYKNELDQNK